MITRDGKSTAIHINNGPKKTHPRQMAASCPVPQTKVPKAPTSRPSIPKKEPPPMTLPPSPPVFSPIEINAAAKQANNMQKILSRTFTLSSSCPSFDPTLLVRAGMSLQALQAPIPISRDSIDLGDFDVLGKSPTIFSLLSTSAGGGGTRSSLFTTHMESDKKAQDDYDGAADDGDLLFPISIDEDSVYLGGGDQVTDLQSLFL